MLVVDDDAQVCDVLERVFRDAHQVIVVHNGSEAVESFTSGRYSVALIDLGIPGMAGDEVAARIRALDPALATVLVTGWELDAEDPRLLAFDARIAKPFEDLDRVVSEVARAMALTRRRRQEHLPKDGSGRA